MNEPYVLIVAALAGLGLLFAGYPLFRVLLVVTGALAGFTYGPELLGMVLSQPPLPWMAWAAAAGGAVILALVAWQLHWLALVAFGMYVGTGVGLALGADALIAIGAGVVGALLALALGRAGIIVLTALLGAWYLVQVFLAYLGPTGNYAEPVVWAAVVIVAVMGAFVQFRSWREGRSAF